MTTQAALAGSTATTEKPVPGPLRRLTRVRATTVAPGANPFGIDVGVIDGVRVTDGVCVMVGVRVMVAVFVTVGVAVAVAVGVAVGGAAVSRR